MYSNNRDAYRQTYFDTWQKYHKRLPLETLEAQLIEIILMHPEYHTLLDKPDAYRNQSFILEENPFYHMSLHLSVQEQICNNRPSGIALIYQQLIKLDRNAHEVQHQIMTCLAQIMQQAQQNGLMPDEQLYLAELKKLL